LEEEDKEILPLYQKFFQNVLAQVSVMLHWKEKQCKDKELITTFEEQYKALQPLGYKPGYTDYTNTILGNG
jgi:hypothetical protein